MKKISHRNKHAKEEKKKSKYPTHNSHDVWCDVTSSARDKIHNKYEKMTEAISVIIKQ